MKFFQKELSKRLEEIGCVSETPFYYYEHWPFPVYDITIYPKVEKQIFVCTVFSIYDFLSDGDYVKRNLEKVFTYRIYLESLSDCSYGNYIETIKKDLSLSNDQENIIKKMVFSKDR